MVEREQDRIRRSLWRKFFKQGLPEWKERRLRMHAKQVHSLDPDLASFKSFSMVAKVHQQAQRNYDNRLAEMEEEYETGEEYTLFKKNHGLSWF